MSLGARSPGRLGALPGQSLVMVATGVLIVTSLALVFGRGLAQPEVAAGFGALIAVGELARIKLPHGRELAPVATAAGLAYTFLVALGPTPTVHGPFQVIVVTSAATLLGAAPHAAAGRPIRLYDMTRRVLVVVLAALVFRPFADELSPAPAGRVWVIVMLLTVVVLAAGLLEVVVTSVATAGLAGSRLRATARDEVRTYAPVGVAVGASALLLSTAARALGWWALAVCVAPLVVTQIAYRRYSGIRATYLQTIRALSRVTEVGGYVRPGHSRRVSHLALLLGREVGLPERELPDLEYAALMHDIGQLSLREPNPSGATVHTPPTEQRQIAELGAEVVRQTGVLDRVADIVAHQADHYDADAASPTGEAGVASEGPPLASRIVRVANAYDDLTGGASDPRCVSEAVHHIRHCGGHGYDPGVVEALARVVGQRR